MLVLLLLIEENVKGIISLDSLACEIILLVYLFPSFMLSMSVLDVKLKLFKSEIEGGKCGD